jgi:ABC-2 type transport system permease protein
MRILGYLLQKEFIQIIRNKTILRLIFILPVVQLIILVNAATLDMKDLHIGICDQDHSTLSSRLIRELDASPFFIIHPNQENVRVGEEQLATGATDLFLVVPDGFEKSMVNRSYGELQLLANAINSQKAQLGYTYLQQVANKLGSHFQIEMTGKDWKMPINAEASYWYNPELNYKHFMLPGILVILVSVVGMFLTAMNLVREKEMGTIEQINVTPVRKQIFLIAKLLPFLMIGLFELGLGLLIGKFLYGVPMEGSLWLLFGIATIYLIGLLGLGLLLSTFSRSQQQVTFVSYFFLLVFILMSGIFTSVENMPEWARMVDVINPFYYFIDMIRAILLKGAGFFDLWQQILPMSLLAVSLFALSVLSYRKQL